MALLVVVPEGLALDSPEVERWMDLLKIERERQRLTSDQLPLLRLSMGRAQHRAILEKLGLRSEPGLRTFSCRRNSSGWPSALLGEHSEGMSPDRVVLAAVRQVESPESSGATVGVLLVVDAASRSQVQPFLEELGRYWLQRYGRIRPAPYPLASYDAGNPEVAEALVRAFPELTEDGYPVVALCTFVSGQPQEVLQLYRGLETPASLVRELSAARGDGMARGARALPSRASSLPGAGELGLSGDQERVLLVSRLNETAQQLWNGAKEDKSLRNQGAKRLLIALIEDSRRVLAGEKGSREALDEGLRDYLVEPLSSNSEQALRLLELARAILENAR